MVAHPQCVFCGVYLMVASTAPFTTCRPMIDIVILCAGESPIGPVVKLIMDHPRCAQLREGDVLLEVNEENVQDYPHPDLVNVLKRCPKGNQASFLVLRHHEVWNMT